MIDLRSDTVTKPTAAMREAMARAEVGDDVYEEDPTVNALQEYAAALLGKEAALFVPSGTMANLIAFLIQARPGDTVILAEESHPFHYEAANLSRVGGLMPWPVPDAFGKLTPDAVEKRIVQIDDPHFSHTAVVSIENTTNRGGGACYDVEEVRALGALAREHGIKLHCDGARLFNACAATGASAADYAQHCDTICFCLSKGLGAPAGSILAGTRSAMRAALQCRKMLGGGMRQIGILAAAGLHALQHHLPDLAEDHRRAREFRAALEANGGAFVMPSPTNILYLRHPSPFALVGALAQRGVFTLPHEADSIRAVFHRDIDDTMLGEALDHFKAAYAETMP
ncbi:MAG: aminotransferase class I/II-fold pyridoxal phosphate-dependent enzyme [Candidatus Hydrogenedens sp.]|nr:aminotransferase class I/II-fold pyridoxal phosphate-dependent enzyme [Candidatus Hydrogenedens sp.]